MNENVDKSHERLLSRRRQAIKQTLSPYAGRDGVQTKCKLAREIAFAKAIILPAGRHSRAARITKNKWKVGSQTDGPPKRFLRTGAHTCNPDTKTWAECTNRDTNKIPEKGCLCRNCDKIRKDAYTKFVNPSR